MNQPRPTSAKVLILIVVTLLVTACGGSTAATPAPAEPLPRDVLLGLLLSYTGPIGRMETPADTLSQELVAHGTTQAFSLTGGNPPCPGWVNTTPDYIFQLATSVPTLNLTFEVSNNVSLILVGSRSNEIYCTDAPQDALTSRPNLAIEQPALGMYAVFVGRGNLASENRGTLTVAGQ